MKIYLAGPMTGFPEHNWPLFFRTAAELRVKGYEVFNPAERESYGTIKNKPWAECLREDLRHLLDCDAIATLPGWAKSRGATLEVTVAEGLGLPHYSAEALLDGSAP